MERSEKRRLGQIRVRMDRALRELDQFLAGAALVGLSRPDKEARALSICRQAFGRKSDATDDGLRKACVAHKYSYRSVGALFQAGYLVRKGSKIVRGPRVPNSKGERRGRPPKAKRAQQTKK